MQINPAPDHPVAQTQVPVVPRSKSSRSVVVALLSLAVLFLVARFVVTHYRRPGSMSVIEAQSMDMSVMKPPIGAVPVEVAMVSRGELSGGVSYTGSVLAFNDSVIAPRVTGRIIAMPVYPGDHVRRGQLLAKLDSDELRANSRRVTKPFPPAPPKRRRGRNWLVPKR
jgi:multidrug efflux pump subunit AcrA (membrane-fusion protein)